MLDDCPAAVKRDDGISRTSSEPIIVSRPKKIVPRRPQGLQRKPGISVGKTSWSLSLVDKCDSFRLDPLSNPVIESCQMI